MKGAGAEASDFEVPGELAMEVSVFRARALRPKSKRNNARERSRRALRT